MNFELWRRIFFPPQEKVWRLAADPFDQEYQLYAQQTVLILPSTVETTLNKVFETSSSFDILSVTVKLKKRIW